MYIIQIMEQVLQVVYIIHQGYRQPLNHQNLKDRLLYWWRIMRNNLKPILWGGLGEKTSNNGMQFYQQRRIYDADSIAMCHPSQIPGGSYMYRIGDDNMERIRKLTPCECWRLQGFSKITKTEDGYEFDDTLFRRAESVNSNTQLYKQAGNSITVNVLEHIFTNLFITMSYDAPEGQMTFNEI